MTPGVRLTQFETTARALDVIERALLKCWRVIRTEIRATRPVFVFFLIGFLLVLLIVKLSLAEYSIHVSALSRALLGAILAAKVVILFERTPLARLMRDRVLFLAIICKSLVYGAGVIILGLGERLIEVERQFHSPYEALSTVVLRSDMHRLLAVSLGVTLVFGTYFCLSEIDRFIGQGTLWALFFKPRASATPHRATEPSFYKV